MSQLFDWMKDHPALLWTLAGLSFAIFAASLFVVPAIVVRFPPDYYTHEHRPPGRFAGKHPALRITALVAKNVLGAVLLLGGVAMLALPGQGLLTLFVGFMLVTFPGKYRIESWVVAHTPVGRVMNWLRRKHDRPPLVLDKRPPRERGEPDPSA